MARVFRNIYDGNDTTDYNEPYNVLFAKLESYGNYTIENHIRSILILKEITVDDIDTYEYDYEWHDKKIEAEKLLIENIDNKSDFELAKDNLKIKEHAESRSYFSQLINIYNGCLRLINSRLELLQPEIGKYNEKQRLQILEKSESKFLLKDRKIVYDPHYERVFELLFVLNENKIFNKWFNKKEIKNIAMNYFIKYGDKKGISNSAYLNKCRKCNTEPRHYFNLKELEENNNFGYFGEINFSKNFTKLDILYFVELVNLLFPTKN